MTGLSTGPAVSTGSSSCLTVAERLCLLVLLVLALGGCAPDRSGTNTSDGSGNAAAAQVAYELRGDGRDPVVVQLEVAADPESRQQGLSNRRTVPDGTGMVFLFPGDTQGPFWMQDTLVPLSIAFLDVDGRVVDVQEMTPCTSDPCPLYRPSAPYRSAVELQAGAFDAAGVGPGDKAVPVDSDRLPVPS